VNSEPPPDRTKPAIRAAAPPPLADPAEPQLGEPPPVHTLSAEEQMALFEKELKEKDWGHQPC